MRALAGFLVFLAFIAPFLLFGGLFAAYAVIPAWIACAVIYLLLSKVTQKPVTESAAQTAGKE